MKLLQQYKVHLLEIEVRDHHQYDLHDNWV